jgi:hypothetical protein
LANDENRLFKLILQPKIARSREDICWLWRTLKSAAPLDWDRSIQSKS